MELKQIMDIAEAISLVLSVLTILATVIVKATQSKEDDAMVEKYSEGIWKFISWLPYFGVSNRTKKLEEAYKELKEIKKEEPK